MIELVAFFLAVALILYCILGGADFGAGILELVGGRKFRKKHRSLINRAMGPVWEANHVWLILAVVILFTAFPPVFRQLSITYHVPLTLLLFGITVRGCAFTFRHYDAVKDESQKVYSFLFVASSFLTPLFLGMIAGSMPAGLALAGHSGGWLETYFYPWFNWYSFVVGLFTVALFGYVAAVYLTGEADESDRGDFAKMATVFALLSVFLGLIVFFAADVYDDELLSRFLSKPISLACIVAATILFVPVRKLLLTAHIWWSRTIVSAQVGAVIIGWLAINFPTIIATDQLDLGIYNAAAPDSTLFQLLVALGAGCLLIFPALGYLMYVFKRPQGISAGNQES